ncbi:Hypothetical predicted protein, partial [Marmota monax]
MNVQWIQLLLPFSENKQELLLPLSCPRGRPRELLGVPQVDSSNRLAGRAAPTNDALSSWKSSLLTCSSSAGLSPTSRPLILPLL